MGSQKSARPRYIMASSAYKADARGGHYTMDVVYIGSLLWVKKVPD